MTLIFQQSHPGCLNDQFCPRVQEVEGDIPVEMLRVTPLDLPEVAELDVIRHYTRLSRENFSIETHFYPLGSCAMKYSPRLCHKAAMLPGFLGHHPLTPESFSQGTLACLHQLQIWLAFITGMDEVCLTPMASAQGEWAGLRMIAAYHQSRGDVDRVEMLVPDAAHGTGPASAAMCGFEVREIPTTIQGDVDIEALARTVGPKTAGIMLANPSTLGVFERDIEAIAKLIHQAGGLLYYDGANLNAIIGKLSLKAMGFDVVRLNLQKTFTTPHGGGPGAGPIAVTERLQPFLPVPRVTQKDEYFAWLHKEDCPDSIGRMSAFYGDVGVLLGAYAYIAMLGQEGLVTVAEYATLNANYLLARLNRVGFDLAYPDRRATNEFCLTLSAWQKAKGVTATDLSNALLDRGFHAPTVYFSLLVPECLLIEPTETENKQTLDAFVGAMQEIAEAYVNDPASLKQAPTSLSRTRMDEVQAAKILDVAWREKGDTHNIT